jgi:hypothetical protein
MEWNRAFVKQGVEIPASRMIGTAVVFESSDTAQNRTVRLIPLLS